MSPEFAVGLAKKRIYRLALNTFAAFVLSACCEQCPILPGCQSSSNSITGPQATASITATASTSSLSVPIGSSANTSIAINVAGGATGATLGFAGPLPPGLSATFTPSTVNGSGTSSLNISASSLAELTIHSLSVVATATGPNAATSVVPMLATVVAPFTIAVPASATVGTGAFVERTISITRAAGITDAVTFNAEPGTVPPGATVTFTPATTTGSTTTVRMDVANTTPLQRYAVRLRASNSARTETADWDVNVIGVLLPPDITITPTPVTATVTAGATATYLVDIARSAPGIGNIVMSTSGLPSGATATFTPGSVAGSSTQLAVATTAALAPGNYPFTITGTAGSLVRSATATLVVEAAPELAITVAPTALSVQQGGTGQATVSLQRTGAVGLVTLDAPNLPTGVTATFNQTITSAATSVVTFAIGSAVTAGTYPITIRGIAGSLTRTTSLSLSITVPPPPPLTITLLTPNVTVAPGQTAFIPVRLTRTGTAIGQLIEIRTPIPPAGGNAWVSPNITTGDTATLQIIGGTVGTSTVPVTAVFGSINPTAVATVTVVASTTPDFSLNPLPKVFTLRRGMFTPLGLDIIRTNGFAGEVALSAVTDQPGAYAVEFTPTSTTGTGVAMRIYASDLVPLGAHLLVIRGTSGGLTRTAVMTLIVQP